MAPHTKAAEPGSLAHLRSVSNIFVNSGANRLTAFGIYLLCSVAFFGRLVVRDPCHFYVGTTSDPSIYIWSLEWWPYAIRHGLNPFWTHAVWAPYGINLAWVTSIPALSLLIWPITTRFGPVAAYNLLALMIPAVNGWACYLLCRHVSKSFVPALVGGWIFAFSPYSLGQTHAHLVENLTFAAPLAVYLVLLRLDRRIGTSVYAGCLGLLLAFQLGVATEIFATMTLFGAIAWLLARWFGVDRGAMRQLELQTIAAYLIALVLASPLLYYVFAFGTPAHSLNSPRAYSSDLLNFLLPTSTTLVHCPHRLAFVCAKFSTNSFEAAAYISPALILIFAAWVREHWGEALQRFLLTMFMIIAICSLGPRLHIAGHDIIDLPWAVVRHLPLINSALPARFMAFAFLVAAIIVSLWLAEGTASAPVRIALGLAAIAFLLPNPSAQYWNTKVDTPAFFSDAMYQQWLVRDENVLIIPYGPKGNSVLWQAQSHMWFNMAGGHLGPKRPSEFERWPVVVALLNDTLPSDYGEQLRAFLAAFDVRNIIIADGYMGPWSDAIVSQALGNEPVRIGGVKLYRAPQETASKVASAEFKQAARSCR